MCGALIRSWQSGKAAAKPKNRPGFEGRKREFLGKGERPKLGGGGGGGGGRK
jgi:hypothetical protein